MDTRAYLKACQMEAERKAEARQKKIDAFVTPVIVCCFWATLIGVWLLR